MEAPSSFLYKSSLRAHEVQVDSHVQSLLRMLALQNISMARKEQNHKDLYHIHVSFDQ